MHDAGGWLLSARESWVFLGVWIAAVLAYGAWRSMGAALPDPIRQSGPFG